MKEHIIRAILYQNMSVEWKDAELIGDVNVHLNVHQKTRQFVEVELGDFILNEGEGEAILVAFEKSEDGELYHENPVAMEKVNDENGVFRLQIPPIVHNTPGEWGVQFFVVTDYDPATGNYTNSYPSDKMKFSEYSSFFDDGLTVPSADNLKALYNKAKEYLSVLGDKVDVLSPSSTEFGFLYRQIGEETSLIAYTNLLNPNTIMYRDENGRAQVESPVEQKDIVNLEKLQEVESSIRLQLTHDYYNISAADNRFAQKSDFTALQSTVSQNVEKISVNARNIQSLLAMQAKTVMEQTLTDSYTARQTADGALNIVDGALTYPTKISGKTVKPKNLFDINTLTKSEKGDVSINGNTATISNLPVDSKAYFIATAWVDVPRNTNLRLTHTGTFAYTTSTSYDDGSIRVYSDVLYGTMIATLSPHYNNVTFNTGENDRLLLSFYRHIAATTTTSTLVDVQLEVDTGVRTEYTPYFTGLKHSQIKGVRSIGRNLFNPKSIMVGKNYAGGDFPPRSTSETIKIENQQYYTIKIKKFPKNCDRYEVSFYEADKKTYAGSTGWQYTTDAYSFMAYHVNSRAVYASVVFASFNDVVFQESDFSDIEVYLVKGDTIEKEEPYTEDTSFAYNEAQQLKEWDYLLPQDGKKITQTDVITFDGTENWVEAPNEEKGYVRFYLQIAGLKPTANANTDNLVCDFYPTVSLIDAYHNGANGIHSDEIYSTAYFIDGKYSTLADWKAHLSELAAAGNPLTVAYKTVTATETDLKPEKSSYFANEKGREIVDEGETKNSEYGATVTIEQDYAVWIGGEE